MSLFVLLSALLLTPALAGDKAEDLDTDGPAAEAVAASEYSRLREELDRLARKNAWSGVERTFQKMLATGVEPEFDDLKTAAHAAQALGDVGEARARLAKAAKIKEERELLDWLWAIDDTYGEVSLAADPNEAVLSAQVMPFDPVQNRAVQYAIAQVAETGMFTGLLPKGEYVFATLEVEVQPRVSTVRIDLRSDSGVRKTNRKQKKADNEG